AVDEQDDRRDLFVFGELFQKFELVPVFGDEALHAHPRNLLGAGQAYAFGGGKHHQAEGEEAGDDRQRPPRRQAPTQPAAIKHGLGFERHGSSRLAHRLSPTRLASRASADRPSLVLRPNAGSPISPVRPRPPSSPRRPPSF